MNDEKYDYRAALEEDIRAALEEKGIATCPTGLEAEHLYDEFWFSDSVTGNASGSYYCSTWKAESALCHNLDLLREAAEEFACDLAEMDPETADVTIRCYLLHEVLDKVLSELPEATDEEEDA